MLHEGFGSLLMATTEAVLKLVPACYDVGLDFL